MSLHLSHTLHSTFNKQHQSKQTQLISSHTQEINLISQYLVLDQQYSLEQSSTLKRQQLQVKSSDIMQGEDASRIIKKKMSIFHNFQKHLIHTLKNSIKFKRIRNLQTSKLRVAYELWQYFISSKKSTKKLLFSILGDDLIDNPQFKKPINQNSDLHILLAEIDQTKVEKAQNYLKTMIIKQFHNLIKGKILKGRRIQRSQEFKKYFQEFITELSEGELNRRLPKGKKSSIMKINRQFESQQ